MNQRLARSSKARSMAIGEDALRDLLRERLGQDLSIDRRPDGALMLRTPFRFPDGDGFPIHLSEAPSGGLRLSDRGHTLMHISYDHDVDAFMDGTHGALMERIVAESGVQREGGAFCLDTPADRLPRGAVSVGAGAHANLRPHVRAWTAGWREEPIGAVCWTPCGRGNIANRRCCDGQGNQQRRYRRNERA